jgi:hypothetical protein
MPWFKRPCCHGRRSWASILEVIMVSLADRLKWFWAVRNGRHALPCISEWCWSRSRWLSSVPLLLLCLLTAGRNVQSLSQNITTPLRSTVPSGAHLYLLIIAPLHAPFGGVYMFCFEGSLAPNLYFFEHKICLLLLSTPLWPPYSEHK